MQAAPDISVQERTWYLLLVATAAAVAISLVTYVSQSAQYRQFGFPLGLEDIQFELLFVGGTAALAVSAARIHSFGSSVGVVAILVAGERLGQGQNLARLLATRLTETVIVVAVVVGASAVLKRRSHHQEWTITTSAFATVAVTIAAIACWLRAVLAPIAELSPYDNLHLFLAVAAVGFLAGLNYERRLLPVIAIAAASSIALHPDLSHYIGWGSQFYSDNPMRLFEPLGLFVVCAVLGKFASNASTTATTRHLRTLVLLNALNVVDAVLTLVAVERGTAVELNPVVSQIGLIGKILLVAAASAVVYRKAPKALIVPTTALGCVAIWHLGGLFIT